MPRRRLNAIEWKHPRIALWTGMASPHYGRSYALQQDPNGWNVYWQSFDTDPLSNPTMGTLVFVGCIATLPVAKFIVQALHSQYVKDKDRQTIKDYKKRRS